MSAARFITRCAVLTVPLIGTSACRRDKAPDHSVVDAGRLDGGAARHRSLSCDTDPRVSRFAPNIEKTTQRKTFKVRIVSAEPTPPAKGLNTWIVRVLSPSGSPVSSASLALHRESDSPDPSMPDHGHGSLTNAAVVRRANGDFVVEPLDLFMPGVWRVGFDVSAPGQQSDTVAFFFCIPG
jgi:hypothetical protein